LNLRGGGVNGFFHHKKAGWNRQLAGQPVARCRQWPYQVDFIRRAYHQKNEQIGELFGNSYLAASHAVRSFKSKLKNDQKLQTKFNRPNSLFKL
jgi:hypothetical protein